MPRAQTRARPRLLSVNFFPAFAPPTSGGEQRYLNLYRALSQECDIDLVTSTDFGARYEEIWHPPSLCERRFPKDDGWRRAFRTLAEAGVDGDLSGLAFALAVADLGCPLRQTALRLAGAADAVIHEFPYSEPIFRDAPPGREIYNSHNFELGLLSSNVTGNGARRAFQKLLRLERNLALRARLVFATCEEDREKFRLLYGLAPERLRLCPNGYSEAELAPVEAARRHRGDALAERPRLLFLGSQHRPNVEAAEFLLGLAAELPECEVTLAGSLSQSFAGRDLPENLRLAGVLDPAAKAAALSRADLFLNPVLHGSGTSLKSVEALAARLPMVATPQAVRGLALEADVHAALCPRAEFTGAVRGLLCDPERRRRIAEAGAALARERHGWATIARRFFEDVRALDRAPERAGRRKTPTRPLLLALNDYPVADAASGGATRIRRLLGALDADVVLLAYGPACEATLPQPGFLEVTLEKSPPQKALEAQIEPVSANDVVAGLFLAGDGVFADLFAPLAVRSAAVLFEHCYMAPALEWLPRHRPDLPVLYDAHNVETTMKRQLLRQHPWRGPLVEHVAELERRLAGRADLVIACTEEDARHFRSLGAATIVVGNGSLPAAASPAAADGTAVGFLGSAHPPNLDAAAWIVEQVAPYFPEVTFEFVGGVCAAFRGEEAPANVVLHGVVEEAAKSRILGRWSVALNPVLTGGGSSLKLPDYLAHGLATISTPQGSRGFPVEDGGIGEVVEREEFPSALWHLLAEDERRVDFADKARAYAAAHLGWTAQAAPLREWLERRAAPPRPEGGAARPSLLVVTYRYTEPPLGGAEEYLIEVLRWLRPRFATIELAAVDVAGPLSNRHHFGCGFAAGEGPPRVLGELFDAVRLFPPDAVAEDSLFAACRGLERAQLRGELSLYAPFVKSLRKRRAAMPLGGFHPPEEHEGRLRRWTGGEFSFLLPPGSRVFCCDGWTPKRKRLAVSAVVLDAAGLAEKRELYRQDIEESFSLKLAFAEDAAPEIVLCEVDEHAEPDDHRPFGVLVEWACALVETAAEAPARRRRPASPVEEIEVDLGLDLDRLLSTEHFAAWVERLSAAARAREEAEETAFAAVRGPHSAALQGWLAERAGGYDTVLVQGIPFDTVPSTVETLAALPRRPRLVVLPHFHAEDRFYYWRRTLDGFAAADNVLLFSQELARRLGDPAKNAVVPGGGVRIEEAASAEAIERFREAHPSPAPFFLVLGRKTPSKGYDRVLRALARLREAGSEIEIVMIGPDDDGLPVEEPGADYLGFQPREIVLGALADCLGLVTMSGSESFGIVLCEAWKFEKPVIANRACAAFRELVLEGETGLLVETDEELADAMAQFAADAELRARLGAAGCERAVANFAWQCVAERVGEVLLPGDGPQATARRPPARAQRRERTRSSARPAATRGAQASPVARLPR